MVNCDSKCYNECYSKDNIYLSIITKTLIVFIVIFLLNNLLLFLKNDIGLNLNGIDLFKSIRNLFKKDESKE